MTFHSGQSKVMSLNLSSDAKPRLKWTRELHQQFVDAVNQVGGADKASPKSLMRIMGIYGLTLYHIKSHLQKYRQGRSHQTMPPDKNKQEDNSENQSRRKRRDGVHEQTYESSCIGQALQLQMEVQKKLHEQMELRIEAQEKYLKSVLKKAEETLSGYSSCSIEVERAKAELSKLIPMVYSGSPSSVSALTESDGLKYAINKQKIGLNSIDSGPNMIELNFKGAEQ